MTEDAQSALLKTLEEPPAGVTIILCADREERLLPTVRSRCVRVRLGPVATREIEAILADAGVADAPGPAGSPASRRAGPARPDLALAPDAVAARDEIARTLLDLTGARARVGWRRARAAGRAGELVAALDRVGGLRLFRATVRPDIEVRARASVEGSGGAFRTVRRVRVRGHSRRCTGRGRRRRRREAEAAQVRAPATERRRAATVLIEIWRDVARDLLLVGLGEERRLRDPALLDDLRAAAIPPAELRGFIGRLARAAELLEANVSPELASTRCCWRGPAGRRRLRVQPRRRGLTRSGSRRRSAASSRASGSAGL